MTFVSLQIPDDWSQVCYARIMSFVERYDLIYHPFPVNSQYLKTLGVDSPTCIYCIFKTSLFPFINSDIQYFDLSE